MWRLRPRLGDAATSPEIPGGARSWKGQEGGASAGSVDLRPRGSGPALEIAGGQAPALWVLSA